MVCIFILARSLLKAGGYPTSIESRFSRFTNKAPDGLAWFHCTLSTPEKTVKK